MKKSLILVLLLFLPALSVAASGQNLYAMPQTQVIPIQNTATKGQYELYVKLPENYAENKQTYPVIYFTDAVWHIEMLSAVTAFQMEEVILVGISWQQDMKAELLAEVGAHVSRFRDYSSRKSTRPEHQAKYQFGQAEQHLTFIRNDVMKYIEANFRTDSTRRTYFGYSLGGEFGAFILMSQPDTFKNYILGSPSLKGDVEYIAGLEAEPVRQSNAFETNVLITYGSLEQELGEYADKFITLLKKKNDPSLSLTHMVIEGSHQTAFPMTGVRGVSWLSDLQAKEEKQ